MTCSICGKDFPEEELFRSAEIGIACFDCIFDPDEIEDKFDESQVFTPKKGKMKKFEGMEQD